MPEEIVSGKINTICFAESLEDLEFEYTLREKAFPTVAELDLASSSLAELQQEQSLMAATLDRLKALESTLEER